MSDEVPALTPAEIEYLHKMILEDQRRTWLAKQMLAVATWVAGTAVAATLLWDSFKRIIKSAV